jgi:thiol:disulfide interchange protein DsbD
MHEPMRLALALFAFFSFFCLSAGAGAQTVVTDHARTSLVAQTRGAAPGAPVPLAFVQEVEVGWHVYWKNPGDSGLPLEFVWTLPEGAAAGAVVYPAPERIEIGPLVNFGHTGQPVFLTSVVAPPNAPLGSTFDIGLTATWLICADICVPETGEFKLALPIVEAPPVDPESAPIFEQARAAAPRPSPGKASFHTRDRRLTLELPAIGSAAEGIYFIPETAGVSEPSAAQRAVRRADGVELIVEGGPALASVGRTLKGVVLVGDESAPVAYELSAERMAPPAGGPPSDALIGLLLAAFLGGALLNLMPCVFPILFVKAASMAEAARDGAGLRRHGLLYAAGVMATFAALAGLLLALKAGGESIGWGFHLQSPVVVALSAYILFAVGLNLAGAFHVGASLQNVGGGLIAGRGADATAFLTGALAVFVAAPCVGPFLTAPIGAAAALPPAEGLAIFMAMAAGLATPYAALSFAPGAARLLPRPGPWMELFRQVLAFPVLAAAGFFIWVLAAQSGPRGLGLGLAGLLLVALAARIWEWGGRSRRAAIAAAAALAASLIPAAAIRPKAAAEAAEGTISYDTQELARRRAAAQPVFINFTAAWCVTCQVDKLTVLTAPRVRAAFREADVALMTADWTNRDPEVTAALAAFGANGVPLYVYYPPGGEAIILPQPLTQRSLLSALDAEKKGD